MKERRTDEFWSSSKSWALGLITCGGVEDVVSVLTLVRRGVAQVFHVLLVELPGTARGRRGRRGKGRRARGK